jgi:hypothetical protein
VKAAAIGVLILACGGCTARRPPSYRLVVQDTGALLVPPGVATPDVTKRTFAFRVAPHLGPCPSVTGVIEVQDRENRIVLTVTRDALAKQPDGWLSAWTADLEAQGCLAQDDGVKLAARIVEALPLELNAAFRLLHGSEVDIGPQTRLEVVSPVFREGTPLGASPVEPDETTENGDALTVTVRAADNLIGFETAWYGIRPHTSHAGSSMVPLRAERNVQGKIEPLPRPATNAFAFPAEAAFYRLFYKADQTEFTALAVAARTQAELEERTKILEAGPASCKKLNDDLCLAIPKGVGVNAYIAVSVNGSEVVVHWPATVRSAIQKGGEDARTILSRLVVRKDYGGRLVTVKFDRSEQAILGMILTGGETIAWK